jgi:G3E family GTPase
MTADTRIPVSIITGFLGSGKTTLLNCLLRHPSMANSLVIINEFGEIGIDHLLVSIPSENMLLLNNGCLCCVFKGDLGETFADVYAKRARGEVPLFDQVIVETTGLADPVPILQTIVTDEEIARNFCLAAVTTLVDGVHGEAQLEQTAEAVKQVAVADSLLVSKTDLAGETDTAALRERLKTINPGAAIYNVTHGEFDPDILFRSGMRHASISAADIERWLNLKAFQSDRTSRPYVQVKHSGLDARTQLHGGDIQTFSLYYEKPIQRAALALWLNMLSSFRGPDLLRVKGVVNVDGEPVVIHAVQTIVHEPLPLAAWPSDDRRSRLVFITRNISEAEISRTFDAFSMAESIVSCDPVIDPEAYRNFARLAKSFIR